MITVNVNVKGVVVSIIHLTMFVNTAELHNVSVIAGSSSQFGRCLCGGSSPVGRCVLLPGGHQQEARAGAAEAASRPRGAADPERVSAVDAAQEAAGCGERFVGASRPAVEGQVQVSDARIASTLSQSYVSV